MSGCFCHVFCERIDQWQQTNASAASNGNKQMRAKRANSINKCERSEQCQYTYASAASNVIILMRAKRANLKPI